MVYLLFLLVPFVAYCRKLRAVIVRTTPGTVLLSRFNPSTPEFLKLILPSLILCMSTIANRVELKKKQEQDGKQCGSRWDGSLWAILSGSTLFAKIPVLVCGAEWVKITKTDRSVVCLTVWQWRYSFTLLFWDWRRILFCLKYSWCTTEDKKASDAICL